LEAKELERSRKAIPITLIVASKGSLDLVARTRNQPDKSATTTLDHWQRYQRCGLHRVEVRPREVDAAEDERSPAEQGEIVKEVETIFLGHSAYLDIRRRQ
jgi:hypothetical protein